MVVQKYHIICNGSLMAKKGREGKEIKERIARKGWRGKEGLPYKELGWLG